MDRFRQALDRARVERIPPGDEVLRRTAGASAEAGLAANEISTRHGAFVYTHTRVFTPAADILERNRVLDPNSEAPAAAPIDDRPDHNAARPGAARRAPGRRQAVLELTSHPGI